MINLPLVASNRPDLGKTVGGAINLMLKTMREGINGDTNVSIATAYINPAGFAILADELNAAPRVRLLLGAEPEFEALASKTAGDSDSNKALLEALQDHTGWLAAERDLSGFSRDAIASAKKMVEWLESESNSTPKVEVRRFTNGFLHGKTYLGQARLGSAAVAGSSNFTYAGLTQNAELNLATSGNPGHVAEISDWFEHYWDQSEAFDLAGLYKEQWEPHSPWHIFVRMLNELYGGAVLEEESSENRLGLTSFQLDGVKRMRRLLEANGGVLVADEVGLGKSYLAGEVIRVATEENRQRAVVICPAAIKASMWDPFLDRNDFKRNVKVYSYETVRSSSQKPNEPPTTATLAEKDEYKTKLKAWQDFQDEISDYAMVVVDEAHNLRNAGASRSEALDQLILSGKHPKQVVLLTATPVNNSLSDLETLVKYFIRDDARFANVGIPSIRQYIKRAQDTDPENLTPEHLFDLMDQVAVRRTRKFVRDNYSNDKVKINGVEQTIKFPTPKSYRVDYDLDAAGFKLVDEMLYALSVDDLDPSQNSYQSRRTDDRHLLLARYTPSAYRVGGNLERHQITNAGLLRSALLKRLESSPFALYNTLLKLSNAHSAFLRACEQGFVITGSALADLTSSEDDEFLDILGEFDVDSRKDVDHISDYRGAELIEDVTSDKKLIDQLKDLAYKAYQGSDAKYNRLVEDLMAIADASKKIDQNGVSPEDRRKVIIFSTFADTVIDLHERLEKELVTSENDRIGVFQNRLDVYKNRLAPPILGAYASTHKAGRAGGIDQGGRATTIAGFAPKTAGEYREGVEVQAGIYDILLTTDVLSEGVNLQQAGRIINYDLPWNPMRIVQRHGRVDRIGSEHDYVHLGLFFPGQKLDEMLGLEATLQRKLAQANAAVGEHIEVLAKNHERTEVILHDKSMKKMDSFLEARGGENAVSGEEYRRRLYKFIKENSDAEAKSLKLPYGSGSGFVNSKIPVSGYVFCAKIAGHEKPWFRFVQVDENWNVELDEDSNPKLSGESLISLIAADPGKVDEPRVLTEEAYSKAFDAWEIAQGDIFDKWSYLADPANVGPRIPASFQRANALVLDHGDFMSHDEQSALIKRLGAVPAKRVELEVGRALRGEGTNKEIIQEVVRILDENGIIAPPKAVALPPVNRHEVRLVTWMAVQGTAGK